jgi:hypothetical protein
MEACLLQVVQERCDIADGSCSLRLQQDSQNASTSDGKPLGLAPCVTIVEDDQWIRFRKRQLDNLPLARAEATCQRVVRGTS